MIIGVQNQLTIRFGTALEHNKILKVRNSHPVFKFITFNIISCYPKRNQILYQLFFSSLIKYYSLSRYLSTTEPSSRGPKKGNSEYQRLASALRTLKFSDESVETMWTVLAAILHLGNVKFVANVSLTILKFMVFKFKLFFLL